MAAIRDLRDKRDAARDALDQISSQIEALERSIAQQAGERERIKNDLRDARRELAQTEARSHLAPNAELARQLARQQASVARLENALAELPETDDEKQLGDLCRVGDQLESDHDRLHSELGRAILQDAEDFLRESEKSIKELETELQRQKMERDEQRESIPDLVREWPELFQAAQRVYGPTPAPVVSRPDPTRQVMRAFTQYVNVLCEFAPDASQVVGGQNIVGWMELSASEIDACFRGNTTYVARKGNKIEDLC